MAFIIPCKRVGWKIYILFPVFSLSLCCHVSLKFLNMPLSTVWRSSLILMTYSYHRNSGFEHVIQQNTSCGESVNSFLMDLEPIEWWEKSFLMSKRLWIRVWHITFFFKFIKISVPGQLIKIYIEYFKDRFLVSRVGNFFLF